MEGSKWADCGPWYRGRGCVGRYRDGGGEMLEGGLELGLRGWGEQRETEEMREGRPWGGHG